MLQNFSRVGWVLCRQLLGAQDVLGLCTLLPPFQQHTCANFCTTGSRLLAQSSFDRAAANAPQLSTASSRTESWSGVSQQQVQAHVSEQKGVLTGIATYGFGCSPAALRAGSREHPSDSMRRPSWR